MALPADDVSHVGGCIQVRQCEVMHFERLLSSVISVQKCSHTWRWTLVHVSHFYPFSFYYHIRQIITADAYKPSSLDSMSAISGPAFHQHTPKFCDTSSEIATHVLDAEACSISHIPAFFLLTFHGPSLSAKSVNVGFCIFNEPGSE